MSNFLASKNGGWINLDFVTEIDGNGLAFMAGGGTEQLAGDPCDIRPGAPVPNTQTDLVALVWAIDEHQADGVWMRFVPILCWVPGTDECVPVTVDGQQPEALIYNPATGWWWRYGSWGETTEGMLVEIYRMAEDQRTYAELVAKHNLKSA